MFSIIVIYILFIDYSKGNTTVIPSGKGSLNIYNGFECDVAFSSSLLHTGTIDSLDMINLSHTLMTKKHIVKLSLTFSEKCSPNIPENFVFNTTVTFVEGKVRKCLYGYY